MPTLPVTRQSDEQIAVNKKAYIDLSANIQNQLKALVAVARKNLSDHIISITLAEILSNPTEIEHILNSQSNLKPEVKTQLDVFAATYSQFKTLEKGLQSNEQLGEDGFSAAAFGDTSFFSAVQLSEQWSIAKELVPPVILMALNNEVDLSRHFAGEDVKKKLAYLNAFLKGETPNFLIHIGDIKTNDKFDPSKYLQIVFPGKTETAINARAQLLFIRENALSTDDIIAQYITQSTTLEKQLQTIASSAVNDSSHAIMPCIRAILSAPKETNAILANNPTLSKETKNLLQGIGENYAQFKATEQHIHTKLDESDFEFHVLRNPVFNKAVVFMDTVASISQLENPLVAQLILDKKLSTQYINGQGFELKCEWVNQFMRGETPNFTARSTNLGGESVSPPGDRNIFEPKQFLADCFPKITAPVLQQLFDLRTTAALSNSDTKLNTLITDANKIKAFFNQENTKLPASKYPVLEKFIRALFTKNNDYGNSHTVNATQITKQAESLNAQIDTLKAIKENAVYSVTKQASEAINSAKTALVKYLENHCNVLKSEAKELEAEMRALSKHPGEEAEKKLAALKIQQQTISTKIRALQDAIPFDLQNKSKNIHTLVVEISKLQKNLSEIATKLEQLDIKPKNKSDALTVQKPAADVSAALAASQERKPIEIAAHRRPNPKP